MIIKFLSKIPSIILKPLTFLFCLLIWVGLLYLSQYIWPISTNFAIDLTLIVSVFAFFLLILPYLLYKGTEWISVAIQEFTAIENKNIIAKTNMPQLCLDMLEAAQQKHRYTNYEAKLETYSDWMAFQIDKGNHKMMGDVVEGMNPTKLDEIIKNSFLASEFEGKRGAYDTFSQAEKDLVKGLIVTFDNVFIARNKFLDRLLNTNWFNSWFFNYYAFIEINLITQINLMKDVFDHKVIGVKINTKAMAVRGTGEIAELRFTLDDEDEPSYEEIIMMHAPFFSFTEKEMKDSDTVEVINFMQKFIKKTRKLIR